MDKRFWISAIALTVAAAVLGFIVHGVLLDADYTALAAKGIMRTPDDFSHYMPFMLLADIAYGFGITWIYWQGYTTAASAIGQGLRCGFAVALVSTVPMFLIYCAIEPMPGMLVAKQEVFSMLEILLLGVFAALFNPRPGAV